MAEKDKKCIHSSVSGENRNVSKSFYDGTEPFLAIFTQTQVVLSGVRLTFDERIAQNISDLGAQIENARRTFVHSGDVIKALQDVGRITANYRQRLQAWENEATKREQYQRGQSGEKIAKMKAEHSRVRNKSMLGTRSLTKLEIELHQLSNDSQPANVPIEENSGSNSRNVDRGRDGSTDQMLTAIPEHILESHESAIASVLGKLVGNGLVITHTDANRTVDDGKEQAWDLKLPFALISGWYSKQEESAVEIGRQDYKLRRIAEPRKKRDLRIWLIPKSRQASESLSLAFDRIHLTLEGRNIDACRLDFQCNQYDEMLDAESLPKSNSIRAFVERIHERVFVAQNIPFFVVHADFNNLELSQNQLVLKVRTSS